MRKGKVVSMIVAGALLLAFSGMPGCSHEDSAFVTISIIDDEIVAGETGNSFLNWFFSLFYVKAYAMGYEWSLKYPPSDIKLTVTGEGMEPIEATIPPSSTLYTVEIPSGSDRKITVITYNVSIKNTGRHTVVDLSPGQKLDLIIKLIPMTQISSISGGSTEIFLQWDRAEKATGYYIYRSINPDSGYSMVKDITSKSTGTWNDFTASAGVTYYYKVSVYSSEGEGEPCDYKSAKLSI